MFLLNNGNATGAEILVPKGSYALAVWGTLDGATVTLERKLDPGGVWLSVGADAEMSDPGQVGVDLPGGIYRASVSGGDPSGLYVSLEEIPCW